MKMTLEDLHQAIEQMGLREYGSRQIIIDTRDGRYPHIAKIAPLDTSKEVIIRLTGYPED